MTKRKRTKEQTWSTKYYGTVKTEQHDPPPNKKKNKKGKIRRWTQKYFPKIINEVIKFTKQIKRGKIHLVPKFDCISKSEII